MSLLLQVIELPTSKDRDGLLRTSQSLLRKSDDSAYSIVPSRLSVSTRASDSAFSTESTDLIYRRLSFEDDLFTARVYKRNYRNTLITSLLKSRMPNTSSTSVRAYHGDLGCTIQISSPVQVYPNSLDPSVPISSSIQANPDASDPSVPISSPSLSRVRTLGLTLLSNGLRKKDDMNEAIRCRYRRRAWRISSLSKCVQAIHTRTYERGSHEHVSNCEFRGSGLSGSRQPVTRNISINFSIQSGEA